MVRRVFSKASTSRSTLDRYRRSDSSRVMGGSAASPGAPSVSRSRTDGLTVRSISVRPMVWPGRSSAVRALQGDRLQRVQPADAQIEAVAVTRPITDAVEHAAEQRHRLCNERPRFPILEAPLVDRAYQLLENRAGDGVEPGFDHHVRDLGLPNEPTAR